MKQHGFSNKIIFIENHDAMKRKDFLSWTLSAAGLSVLGIPGCVTAGGKKKNNPVGAHVWVYARDQPDYDVSGILPRIFSDMKYAGLDGVELMEQPLRKRETVQLIAELIDRHQLPLIGTSYGAAMWDQSRHTEILEDVEIIMNHMADLKARTFGTSVGHPNDRIKTEDELDAQAVLLEKLIKIGSDRGIVLNLHNHTYEVENNLYDLKGTLQRIPGIGLGPDLNWLLRADIDPIWFLNEYQNNIVFLHLRDQLESGRWPEALGEGDVNFEVIGNTIREIGFRGEVIIELAFESGFNGTRPIKESLKMSREYLREAAGI